MADEPKKDDKKKDDKKAVAKAPDPKDAAAATAAAAAGGKSSMIGIILGVVVLAGAGAGAGMYVVKSLAPAPVIKPGEKPAAGGHEAAGDAHATDSHASGGLLKDGLEMGPISLRANVTGSGGTRYVTLDVSLWINKDDHPKVNTPSVTRLVQSRLEETMRTYQLDDLQSPNIQARLKKDLGVGIEVLLNSLMPDQKPDHKFVLEVTPTALLTQ